MIPMGEYEGRHLLQACCVMGCKLESPVLLMVLKGLKPESTNCTSSLSKTSGRSRFRHAVVLILVH